MDPLSLRKAAATEPQVARLLAAHFTLMRATSPEESCHVMTADALAQEDVLLLAAEVADQTIGVAGLKRLSDSHGEVKSMHVVPAQRGSGVARALLQALIAEARAQGLCRLSLETGTAPVFGAARALYTSEGFVECPPFGTYKTDPLSIYLTRKI